MTIFSTDVRKAFLEYFKKNGHFIEKSAPLIPHDDPTLLFVNAGMVQFKNVFTQKETRGYKTAASSQKCVRAGGKHNDLENVGKTTRHHTFFEMLGNFSFGDYFKEQAITYAWEFLTRELKLDKDLLSVSIFAGDKEVPRDDEAFRIWHKVIGLSANKIKELGRKDNFWQMGDVGPCGPCTEIHYDKTNIPMGFGEGGADEQVMEIWNLVFMQFEMGTDGFLKNLPAPSVDTGMGLERILSVMNKVGSNYDTDLFLPLIDEAAKISNKVYKNSNSLNDISLRVIADHSRAASFLIADGLFPSNDGRGYVLRRIMRRAIRYGSLLGLKDPFFHDICLKVVKNMGEVYPELEQAKSVIEKIVHQEEEAFRRTLDRGLILFGEESQKLKNNLLKGQTVFKLHETYGFPPDLTQNLAEEQGLSIDWVGFEQAKKEHEDRSQSDLGLKGIDDAFLNLAKTLPKTEFIEQKKDESFLVNIIAILKDKNIAVFDRTPFYAEGGGQVGDIGIAYGDGVKADIIDTKKALGIHLHEYKLLAGKLKVGDKICLKIDWPRREAIKRNHSATHLLHSALRQVLGEHVTQKGSLVAPDKLRFDFSHFSPLTLNELKEIEKLVNQWVLANEEAKVRIMTPEAAKKHGALALFGEKYGEEVRVLDLGSHSIELCGGTHVDRTGDIGLFKIISESPLALGIRRIEAITGLLCLDMMNHREEMLKNISQYLESSVEEIEEKLKKLKKDLKQKDQFLKEYILKDLKERANLAVENAIDLHDKKIIIQEIDFISDPKDLRLYSDLIKDKIKQGIIILGHKTPSSVSVLISITKELSQKIAAGKIVSAISELIGGKGGGRPDFAQAGGNNPQGLKNALDYALELIRKECI